MTQEKTLQQIREERSALESDIIDLIHKFEKSTGTPVNKITISRMELETRHGLDSIISHVQVEINL